MSEEGDPRPPRDDMAFDDPAAWGFCEQCAFDVAVTKGDGVRIEHRYKRLGADKTECSGSGRVPLGPAPVEAKPRKQLSMKKDVTRMQRRAHWQRRRWNAREQAVQEAAIFHNERAAVTLDRMTAMQEFLNGGYDDDGYDHD